MEEKLIEYSDKIVKALEAGVDFAGEQAPLLIQEVLTYYTIYNTIEIIISIIIIPFCIYWIYYIIINTDNEESYYKKTYDNAHRGSSFMASGTIIFFFLV